MEVVQELAVALELPLRSLRSLQRPEVEDGVLVEVGDCYLPRRERFEVLEVAVCFSITSSNGRF